MIVDAHVHLLGRGHTPQPWMTSEHAAIARPFGPARSRPAARRNGVDAVVLVQGACLDSDTDYLLAEAVATRLDRSGHRVAGARRSGADESETRRARDAPGVPCGPTPHPQRARPALDPAAVGPRSHCAARGARRRPGATGRLPSTPRRRPHPRRARPRAADRPRSPRQAADRNGRDGERGSASLRAAAASPNVLAKLSGLNTALDRGTGASTIFSLRARPRSSASARSRLMCGSDWPVALLNGDYDRVWDATRRVVEAIAASDADGSPRRECRTRLSLLGRSGTTASAPGEGAWRHR